MKNNPKKIMEIVFIFILPIIFMLPSFYVTSSQYKEVFQDSELISGDYYLGYEGLFNNGPIESIVDLLADMLGESNLNYNGTYFAIIDYMTLWFAFFSIWHLVYLSFDTILHKVMLRKE